MNSKLKEPEVRIDARLSSCQPSSMIAYTVHIGEPKESKPLREIAKAFFVALPRLFRIPGSTPKTGQALSTGSFPAHF